MRRLLPPPIVIRYWLNYDEETGIFTRSRSASKSTARYIGSEAGCLNRGYRYIGIRKYGQVQAHLLAWVLMNGAIPDGMEVDHIDCDPSNNAISNLRLATSSQQKMNKRVQGNNRAGLKGAFYHAMHKGKKWRSQIKVDGRVIFLGYFETKYEAHEAYGLACVKYFGEFARAA